MASSSSATAATDPNYEIPSDRSLIDVLSSSQYASSSSTSYQSRSRLSTPELSNFLTSLTTLTLPSLLSQPVTLASEAAQLTNSLTNLCTSEYPTFLSLHETASVLSSSLDALGNSLNSLLGEALPELEGRTQQFARETQGVRERRRKARVVLEREDALVDVLEIPTLIETCVRNGHYQEALDLAAHARLLVRTTASASEGTANEGNITLEPTGDVILIRAIAEQAENALYQMRAQLLALLHAPAKLPALYKAISFLRKMDANLDEASSSAPRLRVRLSEPELALAFLTGRLSYLEDVLSGIEKTGGGEGVEVDHARYLRKYVDVWREGVHDVVTQYTSIFLDRSLHSFTTHTPSSKSLSQTQSDIADPHKHEPTLHLLIATASQHLLFTHLIPTLAAHLEHVPDALSLSALMTQLTHCSAGCARLGLDFRASLPPLFERAVLHRFEIAVEAAANKFVGVMKDAVKYQRTPARWLLTDPSSASTGDDPSSPLSSPLSSKHSSNIRIPPAVLASYQPLAELVNSLLEALNNLRLLAPVSLLEPLRQVLDDALVKLSREFMRHCKEYASESWKSPARGGSRRSEDAIREGDKKVDQLAVLKGASRAFVSVLIPFIRRGLVEGVYSVQGDVAVGVELNGQMDDWEEWLGQDSSKIR
jgi:hypothetical protein